MDWMIFAAGAAGIAAAWGYIKAGWAYLSSFVVVTVTGYDAAAYAVMAYCVQDLKQSRFGPREYQAWRDFVRPVNCYQRIVAENLGANTMLFWAGWRPLIVSRTSAMSGGGDNDTMHNLSKPVKVYFIRGTFDADAFMQHCVDRFNELTQDEASSRYRIYRKHGTAGKPMQMASGKSGPTGSVGPMATVGDEAEDSRVAVMSKRLLRWQPEDIGPAVDADGDAIGNIALSEDAKMMIHRLKVWAKSRDWFMDRGLPWKHGVLLYGEPGTGKTATVRAVAEDLGLPVFVFDLATFYNDELVDDWNYIRTSLPAIVLIEDIDNVFHGRDPVNDKISLTFDALLNCIDGVERTDGLLLFVTTNKPELLDPALGGPTERGKMSTRPGRIDCAVQFAALSEDGRQQIANRILGDWPDASYLAVDQGLGDTGAQFENRCIRLAQELYWVEQEERIKAELEQSKPTSRKLDEAVNKLLTGSR